MISEKICEDIYSNGLKPQHIEQCKELSKVYCLFVENENELFKIFKSYKIDDSSYFSHTFLVTLFTAAIIKKFEWQTKATIETAAMACLLLDVGKVQIPKDVAMCSVEQMSAPQLEQFKNILN